jgi:hypothetical protein
MITGTNYYKPSLLTVGKISSKQEKDFVLFLLPLLTPGISFGGCTQPMTNKCIYWEVFFI